MTNVNFFWSPLVKCQGQKIKNLQKDLITRNIHVKYQSSSTHYSKVISKIKFKKKKITLSGQGHKVKNNDINKKVLSQGILM